MTAIAYFITPHGFGHATRACAVMSALHSLDPSARFEIFTQTPAWIFRDTLSGSFSIHARMTDIGLVQKSPFEEDLDETIRRLDAFLPFDPAVVKSLAGRVKDLGCRMVIADIAPLAILVAQAAGVPSVLVENFTWDWIYEGYLKSEPRFEGYLPYLRNIFRAASFHIQTEPVCAYVEGVDLITGPAGRKARLPRAEIRQKLGIPEGARMVLVTLGGVEGSFKIPSHLAGCDDLYFVLPGMKSLAEKAGQQVIAPLHSAFYHPDLVNACDVMVGKAGYSTLAEAYLAGVPFIYVARSHFREAGVIAAFLSKEIRGFEVSEGDFYAGNWGLGLATLLENPVPNPPPPNGADEIARFILSLG